MTNRLYLDCFAGISGDMFVGALIDLGLPLVELETELAKLNLPGYHLSAAQVSKRGLQATQFAVHLDDATSHDQVHRGLSGILAIIEASTLSDAVKLTATRIFTRLGEAEAAVHGIPIDQVHFHEVGAVDAIIDIVSAAIGIERLHITSIICSPLHLGSGMVSMSHGTYPIPAPATARLVLGVPVYATEARGELTTPTGAAIATTLAQAWGPMPMGIFEHIGHGAGNKDRAFPNVLRALLGPVPVQAAARNDGTLSGTATVIEANIDDMNPQHYEPLTAHLLAAGALDVALLPIQMKKQRPAVQLQIICDAEMVGVLAEIVFRESSTIGVRTHEVSRIMLPRTMITVTTPYGDVRVKLARLNGELLNAMPEYEDCRARAEQSGVSIKVITAAALTAALSAALTTAP